MAGFSLSDAEELTPRSIRNYIVRERDQLNESNTYVSEDVFPTVTIGDPRELFYRLGVTNMPLPGSQLNSEAAILTMDAPETDGYNIRTFKGRVNPDKYLDGQMNRDQQVMNIGEYVGNNLLESLMASRSMATFQGYNGVEGMQGPEGVTPHSELYTEHVRPPAGGQYSDRVNSTPFIDMLELRGSINEVGSGWSQVGEIQAWASPSVLTDLMGNDNLAEMFNGVQVKNLSDENVLAQALPFPINEVKTQVARTDAMGRPLQPDGTPVTDPDNQTIAMDNILEPYNTARGEQVRNVLIGTPGEAAACQPLMIERLADHIQEASDSASVDVNNGYYVRQFTEQVNTRHWREIGSESGFEVILPGNWGLLTDV